MMSDPAPDSHDASSLEARLKQSHTPDKIRRRLAASPEHSYLKDSIYGAIDGTVTTFAVVSGVAGAGLSSGVIIILGFANLVGDGFSMAAGNYLGTRADHELRAKARSTEERHIEHHPDGEREEIRQIYAQKGFEGPQLEEVVAVITADRQRWVNAMLTEELGLSLEAPSPIRAAATTFFAFLLVGLVPLLPFVIQVAGGYEVGRAYLWSCSLTGIAFFSVGAFKSRIVAQRWLWGGLETLLVGGSAAALAFAVGALLRGVTGQF